VSYGQSMYRLGMIQELSFQLNRSAREDICTYCRMRTNFQVPSKSNSNRQDMVCSCLGRHFRSWDCICRLDMESELPSLEDSNFLQGTLGVMSNLSNTRSLLSRSSILLPSELRRDMCKDHYHMAFQSNSRLGSSSR
jgi:hypothetical protein